MFLRSTRDLRWVASAEVAADLQWEAVERDHQWEGAVAADHQWGAAVERDRQWEQAEVRDLPSAEEVARVLRWVEGVAPTYHGHR